MEHVKETKAIKVVEAETVGSIAHWLQCCARHSCVGHLTQITASGTLGSVGLCSWLMIRFVQVLPSRFSARQKLNFEDNVSIFGNVNKQREGSCRVHYRQLRMTAHMKYAVLLNVGTTISLLHLWSIVMVCQLIVVQAMQSASNALIGLVVEIIIRPLYSPGVWIYGHYF